MKSKVMLGQRFTSMFGDNELSQILFSSSFVLYKRKILVTISDSDSRNELKTVDEVKIFTMEKLFSFRTNCGGLQNQTV